MIVAVLLCPRSNLTHSSSFSCFISFVRLKIIVPAYSTWLLKNSPKFFMYILLFFASTTAVKLLSLISAESTPSTALITSESFPTPDGSITMRSGVNFSSTSANALPKSPTSEQQIHPEFISVTCTPESFKNPPSIPISPNSFSINTSFSPPNASASSFLISVVLPAPKKPEIISIFVIVYASILKLHQFFRRVLKTRIQQPQNQKTGHLTHARKRTADWKVSILVRSLIELCLLLYFCVL